ncbi:hypothetical protein [Vibrio sp. 10N]|uniref:hypothetical protein n=1 Tax=Vibrio sp. 10N TaxID=3058938 RepID=UPI0028143957|nr:hypothetical protein VB10N_36870 [Vibrio sp. 10N]
MKVKALMVFGLALMTSASSMAATLTNEQICTAGLALAIDKKPRGIKTQTGAGKRVLLSLKDFETDWDYRCEVNRNKKTIKLEAREGRRNDTYLNQSIRYKVTNGSRAIEVIMKKRQPGVKSETYNAIQLKS